MLEELQNKNNKSQVFTNEEIKKVLPKKSIKEKPKKSISKNDLNEEGKILNEILS